MITGATVPVAVTASAAAAAGLVVGSFLNVVAYRVPRGLSLVRPRSFCPSCHEPVHALDNVPVVSWLVLRGRCRRCGERIAARYPLVEFATGVLFGLLAWGVGSRWAVPGVCALGATALILVAVELDGMRPPTSVAVVGTAIGTALLAGAALADRHSLPLGDLFIGIAVAAGVAGVAAFAGSRRAGEDSAGAATWWALLPAGALLGWLGPIGAVVGGGVVAALSCGGLAWSHRQRDGIAAPRGPRSGVRGAGVAVVAAVGAVAAVVAMLASGRSLGR